MNLRELLESMNGAPLKARTYKLPGPLFEELQARAKDSNQSETAVAIHLLVNGLRWEAQVESRRVGDEALMLRVLSGVEGLSAKINLLFEDGLAEISDEEFHKEKVAVSRKLAADVAGRGEKKALNGSDETQEAAPDGR